MLVLSISAIIGLFFEFIGQIVYQAESKSRLGGTWFDLFYFIILFAAIFLGLLNGTWLQYRLAIVSFLTVALVMVISELDTVIMQNSVGSALKSTGLFFLSFAIIPWICIFGSEPTSVVNQYKPSLPSIPGVQQFNIPKFSNPMMSLSRQPSPPSAAVDSQPGVNFYPAAIAPQSVPSEVIQTATSARALYQCKKLLSVYEFTINTDEANPEDPSELSFQKGEILTIIESKGKWWQARKSDGKAGIVPSNYLELIA
ncbi:Transmembrane osmosensor [Nowakowskiella sp. JEL0078]|nr:Transmembrane osmosensor [Nowakowskiella sp. JEL0078]